MKTYGTLYLSLLCGLLGAAQAQAFGVKVGAVANIPDDRGGATVTQIIPGGLAQECLQVDDIIIAVNDIPVNKATDVQTINNYNYSPNETARVVYQRGNKYAVTGREVAQKGAIVIFNFAKPTYKFGTDFEVALGVVARFNPGQPGGTITRILDRGWAQACMKVGDRLVAINGIAINTAADLQSVQSTRCNNTDLLRAIFERNGYYYCAAVRRQGNGGVVIFQYRGGRN